MKVRQVAEWVNGQVVGDAEQEITGANPLGEAKSGELTFLTDAKKADQLNETAATVIICPLGINEAPEGKTLIKVANPKLGFALLQQQLHPRVRSTVGISDRAVISESALIGEGANIYPNVFIGENVKIGKNVELLPGCYIGDDVTIGDDCWFHSSVSVYHGCTVGHRVTLHSGAVVGSDGFGYVPDEQGIIQKIPQVGIAVIEDDVEIGANACIDRSVMGETRIGQGTKIDNLVQVGHNVTVGPHCFLCSQVGIAGSAKIGHHVTMAGQVGVNGHITVGNQVIAAGKAGVSKDTPDGTILFGSPVAKPMGEMRRILAVQSKLPQLRSEFNQLKKQVAALEKKAE